MQGQIQRSIKRWSALAMLVLAAGVAPDRGAPQREAAPARSGEYGRLPLAFEENRGQLPSPVRFVARAAAGKIFLTGDGATFSSGAGSFRLRFAGARATAPRGEAELPGKANYLHGVDPSKWITGVPTWSAVRLPDLYPATDAVFHGNGRQLEYDLVLRPGARPADVRLSFEGVDGLAVEDDGSLRLELASGQVVFQRPQLYQQDGGGARREISGGYQRLSRTEVAFTVGAYDPAQDLVIDPVLVYSTFLGGSLDERAAGIAIDGAGNAYLAGSTDSTDFPLAGGPRARSSSAEVFVSKLNSTGDGLLYSTYLGGLDTDSASGIAVGPSGNAYVTGNTSSPDFPTTSGAYQTTLNAGPDAFVTQLNAAGSALIYSTLLGGASADLSAGIAVDSSGAAYVAGFTSSGSFPVAAAFQGTFGGNQDAFLTKLNAAGSALLYSTFLGGNGPDQAAGVAVDASGNAYVTGYTDSANFPVVAGAYFGAGVGDFFVTRFNPSGATLGYSATYGGTGYDAANAIAVDGSGRAYVTGSTASVNLQTSGGAYQSFFGGGGGDAFVLQLTSTGAFGYSTYLGGSQSEAGFAIAVDSAGSAYVTGYTASSNFPLQSALRPGPAGNDAFVTKLAPDGRTLDYSTYLGGAGNDEGHGIAVAATGEAFVAGVTLSSDFPARTAFQPAIAGGQDLFVSRLAISGFAFTSGAFSVVAGACSAAAIRNEDAPGSPSPVAVPTTVALSTSSTQGAFYSNAACTTAISSVAIAAGGSTASFFYRDTAAGRPTLTASSPGYGPATQQETISAGSPNHLGFSVQPSNSTADAAIAPAVKISVLDQFENTVTASTASVTVALGSNPAGGSLSGGLTAQAVNGVATFANLVITRAGAGYSLGASSTGLPAVTSTTFDVGSGAATTLAFVIQPGATPAGAAIAPPLRVEVRDNFGNVVTSSTRTITIGFGANPGGGTLGGTPSVAAVGGVATFADLSINRTGAGYALTANASGLTSATSSTFDITPAVASALEFTVQPASGTAGAALSPAVQVTVKDSLGNAVPGATDAITISLGANPAGAALLGTTTVSAAGGVATFSELSIETTGTGYTLQATAAGFPAATSTAFSIAPAAPNRLHFLVEPSVVTAGQAITPAVEVAVEDAYGNLTSSIATVSLTLSPNSSGGVLSGSRTTNASAGVATFNSLFIDQPGSGYLLTASATGLSDATTAPFSVTGPSGDPDGGSNPDGGTGTLPVFGWSCGVANGGGGTALLALGIVALALRSRRRRAPSRSEAAPAKATGSAVD